MPIIRKIRGLKKQIETSIFCSFFFPKPQTTPQILLIKKSSFKKSWPSSYTPRSNAAIEEHRFPDSAHKPWGLNPSYTAQELWKLRQVPIKIMLHFLHLRGTRGQCQILSVPSLDPCLSTELMNGASIHHHHHHYHSQVKWSKEDRTLGLPLLPQRNQTTF